VEALYELVTAHVSVVEEQKARADEIAVSKYQRSIQVILGLLAALSLVGLFEAINQFAKAPVAERVSVALASVELGFVLLAAVAIAVAFALLGRPGGRHGGES
jgi:hypothetical protein